MQRMGLKRMHSKWTGRKIKMAGYRDVVVVDSPIKQHSAATNQMFEHQNVQVVEDDIENYFSFESEVIETTPEHESPHRAKDAPGFVSSRGIIACSEDLRYETIIPPTASPADFVGGNKLGFRSEVGAYGGNFTHQSKMTIETTLENAENDEIELLSNCSSSPPPPDFCLPRKEIREAILYHEELGKALSKLALDPVLKCIDSYDKQISATSTNSTAESTLDATINSSNSRCRVGVLTLGSRRPKQRNSTIGFDDRMEQVSSLDSASSKFEFSCESNQRNRLERQLSFLESHAIKQCVSSTTSSQDHGCREEKVAVVKNCSSTIHCEPSDDFFFPRVDDLQSPQASATSCDSSKCISSPPNTHQFKVTSDDNHSWFDNAGNEHQDRRLMMDDIALMMSEYMNKTRSDVSFAVDTQLEKHLSELKSDVFGLSERLDNKTRALIQKMEHSKGNKETQKPNLDKAPMTPRSGNVTENVGFLHELETAFSSMETRIINTITSEVKSTINQQLRAFEEIVEEKISVAIEGYNLKLVSDIQQIVKQEADRASVISLGDKSTPPTTSLRIGSLRNHTRQSPSLENCGGASTRTRSSTLDNSWITRSSSVGTSQNAEHLTQKSIEDSFSDTMKVIDEFVADCDEIASDFDKIALRMESNDVYHDPDCDTDKFEVLFGTANGFVMF